MDLSDWKTATLVAYSASFAAGFAISPFIAALNYSYKKLSKSEPIGSDYISSLNGALFTDIGVCCVFQAPEYNYASVVFIPGLMAGIYFGGKVTEKVVSKLEPICIRIAEKVDSILIRVMGKTNRPTTQVFDERFGELVIVPNVGWVTKKSLKEAGLEDLIKTSNN
jgi:hypothetical protein